MKKPKETPGYKIEWVDASTTSGWSTLDESTVACNRTWGEIVFEDDKVLKIASTCNETHSAEITTIPQCIVVNIWEVKLVRRRRRK